MLRLIFPRGCSRAWLDLNGNPISLRNSIVNRTCTVTAVHIFKSHR